jgi:hypothetical protein
MNAIVVDIVSQSSFFVYKCKSHKQIKIDKGAYFSQIHRYKESLDSSVGIATGYGLDDEGVGVRVPMGARIFTSPYRPDRLSCPPCLLSKAYRG